MLRSLQSIGIFCAVGAATVAFSPAAQAQSGVTVPRPFTIKLGDFTPSSEFTRSFSGDSQFMVDATYEFGRVPDNPIFFGAYFDYIFQTSQTQTYDYYGDEGGYLGTESDTGHASAYGVGLQARYVIPSYGYGGRREGLRPYVGGGLGIYGVYAKQSTTGYDAGEDGYYGFDYSHTTTGLGGKIMFGVQSRSGFLGEVSYHFLPENQGLDLSGYGFELGYRF